MSLVDFYIFTSPQHLQEYHGDVKNILDYALEERLIDVKQILQAFFPFSGGWNEEKMAKSLDLIQQNPPSIGQWKDMNSQIYDITIS